MSTAIEEKESYRWIEGLRQANQVAHQVPGTRCVCIADSEADIYELFAEPRDHAGADWLVRACQDRAILKEEGGADPVRHIRDSIASLAGALHANDFCSWSAPAEDFLRNARATATP